MPMTTPPQPKPVEKVYLKVPVDIVVDIIAMLKYSQSHSNHPSHVHELLERLGKESRNP